MKHTLLLSLVILGGCAAQVTYTGKVMDCNNDIVQGAKVTAFRNGIVPLTLPPQIGHATTNESGEFTLTATKRAHFLNVTGASIVQVNGQPKLSINHCET